MAGTFLHIIAFNIPYPPDYGGIIDIYYKIKALKEAGVHVILHCYTYGRQPSKELEDLCFKVYYYPRKKGLRYQFSNIPYIVVTRNANTMPGNLLGDSFPVLFEGLHTTDPLLKCKEAGKKVLVRMHNVEHDYYRGLARMERNYPDRLFFYLESLKLKRYEKILTHADHILGISGSDSAYFSSTYGKGTLIPAFQRYEEITVPEGKGEYILFHGNLGVVENEGILRKFALPVISRSHFRVIVAGKNPSRKLRLLLNRYSHINLIPDPSDRQMEDLICNAQVHLILTRQSTGIKLKLMHCLYRGRHCLVNPPMVAGSALGDLCTVVRNKKDLEQQLARLMSIPVPPEEVDRRKKALKDYSNRAGAEKIVRLIS
jgi:hypothetical protein